MTQTQCTTDICHQEEETQDHHWALTRENLSLGYPTKRDSNHSPQLHQIARKLKFRL